VVLGGADADDATARIGAPRNPRRGAPAARRREAKESEEEEEAGCERRMRFPAAAAVVADRAARAVVAMEAERAGGDAVEEIACSWRFLF